MMKPKLLDLFCGAGGAAMGYSRAGFDVVGVDIKPQPHYPFAFVLGDALEYVAAHGAEYDAIHASPPCQKFTTLADLNKAQNRSNGHPDLIADTRQLLDVIGRSYVIENVQGAPLKTQIILCCYSLGLDRLARHRHFESNIVLLSTPCSHRRKPTVGVFGKLDGRRVVEKKYYQGNRVARGLAEARSVMGIDWMDELEIILAIPPAYTEYIGAQLLAYLSRTPAPLGGGCRGPSEVSRRWTSQRNFASSILSYRLMTNP